MDMECTCTIYQIEQVGCDCGHQEWYEAQPKAVAYVWPKGYPDFGGQIRLHYLATTFDSDIMSTFSYRLHESIRPTARLDRIERLKPMIGPPVTDAYARYTTLGDNT